MGVPRVSSAGSIFPLQISQAFLFVLRRTLLLHRWAYLLVFFLCLDPRVFPQRSIRSFSVFFFVGSRICNEHRRVSLQIVVSISLYPAFRIEWFYWSVSIIILFIANLPDSSLPVHLSEVHVYRSLWSSRHCVPTIPARSGYHIRPLKDESQNYGVGYGSLHAWRCLLFVWRFLLLFEGRFHTGDVVGGRRIGDRWKYGWQEIYIANQMK